MSRFQSELFRPELFQPELFQPELFEPELFRLELFLPELAFAVGSSSTSCSYHSLLSLHVSLLLSSLEKVSPKICTGDLYEGGPPIVWKTALHASV
jgi:hypothetical protein